jgi:hypothetical protein
MVLRFNSRKHKRQRRNRVRAEQREAAAVRNGGFSDALMTRWKEEYTKAAADLWIHPDLVEWMTHAVRPQTEGIVVKFGECRLVGKSTAALALAAACEHMRTSVLVLTTNMNEARRLEDRLKRHIGRRLVFARIRPRGAIENNTDSLCRGFWFRIIIHDYYGETIHVDPYNMHLLLDARHVILSQGSSEEEEEEKEMRALDLVQISPHNTVDLSRSVKMKAKPSESLPDDCEIEVMNDCES